MLSNPPQSPSEPPEQFGRYRLVKRLGQGGMGSVYLAEDSELDRLVALKVPDFRPEDGDEARKRFKEEARAAAKLDHPYLCKVFDIGEIDGRAYLTMEFIEGRSLSESIPDNGIVGRQAAVLVGKLAIALQAAHERGVIHRDLKPANIMMKAVGSGREPVIVDFGLARRDDSKELHLTKTGQILGTLGYMAPEQVRGDLAQIGPVSEVYSLGVILYELLTGRVPFSGNSLAVAGQILTQAPLVPSEHRPDVDPRLEAICLKAMAKKVADRYGSMKELGAALTNYLQSQSRTASSPAVAPRPEATRSAPPVREKPIKPLVKNVSSETPSISIRHKSSRSGIVAAQPEPVEDSGVARRRRPIIVAASAIGLVLLGIVIAVATNAGSAKTESGSTLSLADQHEWTSPFTGMKFVRIEPGTFLIGSPEGERWVNEQAGTNSERRITKPFYLGKCEVTQAEYEKVTGQTPSSVKNQPDNPVEMVSWLDAVAFCNALSLKENRPTYYVIDGTDVRIQGGSGYRLPTEAEWEYACRAGTMTRFGFGDDSAKLGEYAWFGDNSEKKTHPVGKKRANAWGLHDMHGNVWEWCWDGYDENYYKSSPAADPPGPSQAAARVVRGGSWSRYAEICRSAYRYGYTPEARRNDLGFRVALVRE